VIRERLAAQPDDVPPPDTLQARALARHALEQVARLRHPPPELADTIDFILEGPALLGVVFLDEADGRALRPRLQRVLQAAQGGSLPRIVVVRDRRAKLSRRAVRTQELLAAIESGSRTCLHWLEAPVLGQLRVIRAVQDEAASGDLAYERQGELRHASPDEVRAVLRRAGGVPANALVAFLLPLAGLAPGKEGRGEPDGPSAGASPAAPTAPSTLGEAILALLAERPVLDVVRIQESLPDGASVQRVETELRSLARSGRVHLHHFQQRLQVRRG